MNKPTCAFSSCGRGVYARKLCSTHYEQQRHGKPLTPIGSYAPQPAECRAGGCPRKPHSGGLCAGHYAQHLRGEPLSPLGIRRSGRAGSRDETLCVVLSCPETKEGDLFCTAHRVALRLEIGSPRPGSCRVLACRAALHSHGFCKVHWLRIIRYGRVERANAVNDAGSCMVEANGERCPEPVHAKGYCRTHYRRVQRTGDPGPVGLIPQVQRKIGKYAGVTCKAEAGGKRCPEPAKALGWCPMHYHRWRRTGDAVGKWGIEPRKSEGYTTTDGYFMATVDGRKILKHRLIMEQIIGRPLRRFEEPHHKNGIRDDNTPSNLELWVKWRQPNGQRLSDLIDFVVTNYPGEVMAAMAARMAAEPVVAP